jgi:Kef-type K+ transport system membrane component KefB
MHVAPNMAVILADLALVLVLARAAGWLFSRLGQPAVVGEILAGVLLGPTLLRGGSSWLFPMDQRDYLVVLADVGLVLFMFIVGLELDVGLVRGRERLAGAVSASSIALPFAFGVALALLLPREDGIDFLPFALFIGAAMSVTAFPVLARIMTERNMHRTETGSLALACAAVDDVLAWSLLAAVIAYAPKHGCYHPSGPSWLVALAVPFAVFVLVVVRRQLKRLTRAYERAGRLTPGILAVVLLGLLVSAAITERLGIHFIFGAFLFGAVMPRQDAVRLRHEILVRLEQISVLLLLPVFFLVSGLQVDLEALLHPGLLLRMTLILAAAITGKFIGAYVGARVSGVPPWQARSLGILMNTRGLTELVIINIGKSLGLIGSDVFSMLVVMALVTTMMTGPLLRRAYPDRRVARDIAEAERAALSVEAVRRRVLVVAAGAEATRQRFELALAVIADERPAEVVVSSIEPFKTTRLEVGSGLSEELAAMTESMTSLEELVQRGSREQVLVNVLTRFSGDVVADLVAQIEAMAPDLVILGARDDASQGVQSQASSQVLVTGSSWDAYPPPAVVRATWGGAVDDDAAVVLAVRIASYVAVPLQLELAAGGSQRRFAALAARLESNGVVVTGDVEEGQWRWRVGSVSRADLDLGVRAEPDPEPVDWALVRPVQARSGLGHPSGG